jgi:hypothetical protein
MYDRRISLDTCTGVFFSCLDLCEQPPEKPGMWLRLAYLEYYDFEILRRTAHRVVREVTGQVIFVFSSWPLCLRTSRHIADNGYNQVLLP